MRIFNYEIVFRRYDPKQSILDKTRANATLGLIQAELELQHHTLMVESAEEQNRTEAEITGFKDAIERDQKSINNWKNQLKAIEQYAKTN